MTKRSRRCGAGSRSLTSCEQPAPKVAVRGTLELLPRSSERLEEAIAIEGLQEIVQRMDVEGLEGVLVEGGHEDEERQLLLAQRGDDVEAVGAGHLNVEKHEIRLASADGIDGRQAVVALADHLESLLTNEQHLQPLAGERLVVRDQDSCHATRTASPSTEAVLKGISIRTDRPGPPSEN